MPFRIFLIVIAVCWNESFAGPMYGDKGCIEQNGAFGFSLIMVENNIATQIQTAYTMNIFPCDMMFISPTIALQIRGGEGYTESAILFGLADGFVFNKISPPIFISAGFSALLESIDMSGFGSGSAVGFQIPVSFGIKIPVRNNFLITPMIIYSYTKSEQTFLRALSFGIGLSGVKFFKEH